MTHTRTPLTTSQPFDLAAVKEYTRVTEDDDIVTLTQMAQTAAAEIEAACDIALLSQLITVRTEIWGDDCIELPVGPVADGATATVVNLWADGTTTPVTNGYWLEGGRYPVLHFTETIGGPLRISYTAGFGDTAAAIPPDLATALHDQTSRLYDTRAVHDLSHGIAKGAARIIARYRRVKL